MTFGEKIRDSRKVMNLTQKQLAERIGAKHNSVSDWENDKNKPDLDTIELLCDILNISPNYLLNSNEDTRNVAEQMYTLEIAREMSEYNKCPIYAFGNGQSIKIVAKLDWFNDAREKLEKEGYHIVAIFENGHKVES